MRSHRFRNGNRGVALVLSVRADVCTFRRLTVMTLRNDRYNWGSFVATLLPLERLAGVTFSASTKVTGADKLGVLTVCDNMPKTWGRASVRVPVSSNMVEMLRIDSNGLGVTEAKGTATTQWIEIEVLRLNATAKQITVLNNPFGALNLQPWAEGMSTPTPVLTLNSREEILMVVPRIPQQNRTHFPRQLHHHQWPTRESVGSKVLPHFC